MSLMSIEKKYLKIIMLLLINNSNRNPKINKYLKDINGYSKKHPVKNTCKKIKSLNVNSKGKNKYSKKCIKYVTDKMILILDKQKIPYKNIYSVNDIIDVIKSNVKVSGIIISGSDLTFSKQKIPTKLILPGMLAIEYYKKKVPIFGICFGFQLINYYFGGKIESGSKYRDAKYKITMLDGNFFSHENSGIYKFFNGDVVTKLGNNFEEKTDSNKNISIAIEHKKYNIFATQFHPELSGNNGMKILNKFFKLCKFN